MKIHVLRLITAALGLLLSVTLQADNVVQDDVAGLSRQELGWVVESWTPEMRLAAANDEGLRRELVTMSLAAKKIALAADAVTPESDPEFYWRMELQIRSVKRHLMVRHYLNTLTVPDMEPLAKERYESEKDKYALVRERRLSSHILFRCVPGDCDREQVKAASAETLVNLRAGGDFAAMVEAHSDDPGTKAKGGQFRWLSEGAPRVSKAYVTTVFELQTPGQYSEVVSSRFGLHIIRLDEIEAARYKPYDEVQEAIILDLEGEYRQLAAQDFDESFGPQGELVLNTSVLDEMLAPYVTLETDAAELAEFEVEEVEAVSAPAP